MTDQTARANAVNLQSICSDITDALILLSHEEDPSHNLEDAITTLSRWMQECEWFIPNLNDVTFRSQPSVESLLRLALADVVTAAEARADGDRDMDAYYYMADALARLFAALNALAPEIH